MNIRKPRGPVCARNACKVNCDSVNVQISELDEAVCRCTTGCGVTFGRIMSFFRVLKYNIQINYKTYHFQCGTKHPVILWSDENNLILTNPPTIQKALRPSQACC